MSKTERVKCYSSYINDEVELLGDGGVIGSGIGWISPESNIRETSQKATIVNERDNTILVKNSVFSMISVPC